MLRDHKVERSDTHINDFTKKFDVMTLLVYYQDVSPDEKYAITFRTQTRYHAAAFLKSFPPVKRFFAKLVGMNPTYMRVKWATLRWMLSATANSTT